jgi:hypothetical protein
MSKIFYDHIIVMEEVDSEIKSIAKSHEERDELWGLVDEIIHNRILAKLLDVLPKEVHQEFLDKFHEAPHDEGLIEYVEEIIKQEVGGLAFEILQEVKETSKK